MWSCTLLYVLSACYNVIARVQRVHPLLYYGLAATAAQSHRSSSLELSSSSLLYVRLFVLLLFIVVGVGRGASRRDWHEGISGEKKRAWALWGPWERHRVAAVTGGGYNSRMMVCRIISRAPGTISPVVGKHAVMCIGRGGAGGNSPGALWSKGRQEIDYVIIAPVYLWAEYTARVRIYTNIIILFIIIFILFYINPLDTRAAYWSPPRPASRASWFCQT